LQGGFKTKNKKLFTYSFSWAPNGPEKGDAEQDFETYLVK